MHALQKAHIDTVLQVAQQHILNEAALQHDDLIRQSWLRCVRDHKLDPTRMQEAVILPHERYREHQDQMEGLMHIARHGLENLYKQVSGLGYVVLLTDDKGVTVDFIGDLQLDASLRKTGLYLGAVWSEQFAGTNGVGTCLSTGESLTVHQADHFDAMHIPLTCTAAPIYGATGKIKAVLDLSALHSPEDKQSQHFALQLVRMYTHQIENAYFLNEFRHDWILRLANAPHFLEVHPEYLLALNERGELIGHNRRAQEFFQGPSQQVLLGQKVDALLQLSLSDLGHFIGKHPFASQSVSVARTGQVLSLRVTAPTRVHTPPATNKPSAEAARIPEALAVLSGGDPELDRQIQHAARLADSPVSVLLFGETGSGKEFFAKAIHQSSARRHNPFVAVNCAAIPEGLIESELFGYAPGSFTGALGKGKRGLIQQANQGTLFLDEIGDMPRALQVRLLRVFSEQEVLPVGASQPIKVNVRLISASHCDLMAMVRNGEFREDLFYRLAGARLSLPPLRQRQDLDWVIEQMLGLYALRLPGQGLARLTPAAKAQLLTHDWPGNLRELRNVIEYASSVARGPELEAQDLPSYLLGEAKSSTLDPTSPQAAPDKRVSEATDERSVMLAALRGRSWNISLTATDLGVSRMTLYRQMKRLSIVNPRLTDQP
jgi:sigma-54 dependent transcriptional regulator, acetoin dehydrogenase operon transcriptional activator AcoR